MVSYFIYNLYFTCKLLLVCVWLAGVPLLKRMIELQAEDSALRDACFVLNDALLEGKINCDTHLRCIRKITSQQFYTRAKLLYLIQRKKQERRSYTLKIFAFAVLSVLILVFIFYWIYLFFGLEEI